MDRARRKEGRSRRCGTICPRDWSRGIADGTDCTLQFVHGRPLEPLSRRRSVQRAALVLSLSVDANGDIRWDNREKGPTLVRLYVEGAETSNKLARGFLAWVLLCRNTTVTQQDPLLPSSPLGATMNIKYCSVGPQSRYIPRHSLDTRTRLRPRSQLQSRTCAEELTPISSSYHQTLAQLKDRDEHILFSPNRLTSGTTRWFPQEIRVYSHRGSYVRYVQRIYNGIAPQQSRIHG